MELSPPSLTPGASVTLAGSGWRPGSEVMLEWSAADVPARAPVDDGGRFRALARMPGDLTPGRQTVRVTGVEAAGSVAIVQLAPTVGDAATSQDVLGGLATADGHLTLAGALVLLTLVVGIGAAIADRRLAARSQPMDVPRTSAWRSST